MSELIRREAALKAIEARAYDLESTDSINTAYGCRLGGDVVRALPAIGTCKECANSKPYDASAVRCAWLKDAVNLRWGDALVCVFVDPDHYCAAFNRRPTDA